MSDILGDRDESIPDVTTRVAEPSRQSQLPKRFYKSVSVSEIENGFTLELDGRSVRTPGRSLVAAPVRAVAEMLAAEWDAQKDRIDPMTMPATRLINTSIDGVATDMQAVKEDIIRYSGSDLLCYRAASPRGLVALQRQHWDPLIDWAQMTLGAHFTLVEGVIHCEQPPETIAAFGAHVGMIDDPLKLSALHVVTTLTGSAVLAVAVLRGEQDGESAWKIAHVDEEWQASQWGEDAEATAARAVKFRDMKAASDILAVLA